MDVWFIFGALFLIASVVSGLVWLKHDKTRTHSTSSKEWDDTAGDLDYRGNRRGGWVMRETKAELPNPARRVTGWVTVGLVSAAVLFLFLSSFVVIQPSHKGVEMTFGKPGTTMGNGFHWKDPIANVVRWDGTVKTYKYSSESNDDGDAIPVLMANGGTVYVNLIYQIRLADNIDQLQRNYPGADMNTINNNLVKKEVIQQLGLAYANYNPFAALEAQQTALLQAVQKGTTPVSVPINPAQTYQAYGQQAFLTLRGPLATQEINLLSLAVVGVTYDGKTQGRIDALNQSIVNTQIALQNEATATAQAQANLTISKNPPTLTQIQQECVQAYFKALEEGHVANAGFVCPGSAGPTSVVPVN